MFHITKQQAMRPADSAMILAWSPMAVSELTPVTFYLLYSQRILDFDLWTVYKVSLITCKHTVDEGHMAKSLGVRSLLHV